jgi:RimJ/RimL family protein N-acetyltransferase
LKRARTAKEFTTKDGRIATIRDLSVSDATAMLRFANQLAREKKTNRDLGVASFDRRLTQKEETKFVRAMVKGVKERRGANAVAFVDGQPVGECTLSRRIPGDMHHTGTIGIVVLDGFRGIGIGERLMTEVLRKSRRLGVWLVELEVVTGNEPAVRLYEKLGFRQVGVIPNKILRDGKHRDIISMYTDLRGSDITIRSRRRKS